MVKAVNLAGGPAELILYPGNGHNCWDAVCIDEKNYDWTFLFATEHDNDSVRQLSRENNK